MSDKQETIEALIAEYRADADKMDAHELPQPTTRYLRILLGRLEAAHRREMKESEDRETKLIKALESANERATKIAAITTVEKVYKENIEVVRHHAVEIVFTAAEIVEEVKKGGGEA